MFNENFKNHLTEAFQTPPHPSHCGHFIDLGVSRVEGALYTLLYVIRWQPIHVAAVRRPGWLLTFPFVYPLKWRQATGHWTVASYHPRAPPGVVTCRDCLCGRRPMFVSPHLARRLWSQCQSAVSSGTHERLMVADFSGRPPTGSLRRLFQDAGHFSAHSIALSQHTFEVVQDYLISFPH